MHVVRGVPVTGETVAAAGVPTRRDIIAVVVTYNSESHIEPLLDTLHARPVTGKVGRPRQKPDLVVTWGTTVTEEAAGRWNAVDPRRHLTDVPVVFMNGGRHAGVPSGMISPGAAPDCESMWLLCGPYEAVTPLRELVTSLLTSRARFSALRFSTCRRSLRSGDRPWLTPPHTSTLVRRSVAHGGVTMITGAARSSTVSTRDADVAAVPN